jgi:hypothetical protein
MPCDEAYVQSRVCQIDTIMINVSAHMPSIRNGDLPQQLFQTQDMNLAVSRLQSVHSTLFVYQNIVQVC